MRDVREKIRRNIVRQYNSEAKGAVRHALADYDEALFTADAAAPVADTVSRVMTGASTDVWDAAVMTIAKQIGYVIGFNEDEDYLEEARTILDELMCQGWIIMPTALAESAT